jgi:hypothetical protein
MSLSSATSIAPTSFPSSPVVLASPETRSSARPDSRATNRVVALTNVNSKSPATRLGMRAAPPAPVSIVTSNPCSSKIPSD